MNSNSSNSTVAGSRQPQQKEVAVPAGVEAAVEAAAAAVAAVDATTAEQARAPGDGSEQVS